MKVKLEVNLDIPLSFNGVFTVLYRELRKHDDKQITGVLLDSEVIDYLKFQHEARMGFKPHALSLFGLPVEEA